MAEEQDDLTPQPPSLGRKGEPIQTEEPKAPRPSPPSFLGKGAGGLGSSDFTSLLFTLRRVPGVFDDAFKTFRFRVAKAAGCLVCSANPVPTAGEDLDVALDQALARLGKE